jgi:holo-[acyl-carrier protein] synthase
VEIGTDIIEVERVARAAERRRFVERVYTETELAYCESKPMRDHHLAGFWAAKEAVIKCLGRLVPWQDIEIVHDGLGKPYVVLRGKALELSRGARVSVSISHCRGYAVAMAALDHPQPTPPLADHGG